MAKKIPSKFPGVRFKNHPTRKHGATPDKYFYIRFRHNGKLSEQGLGWASKGWTAEGANLLLSEFKSNAKSGKGPTSFKEQKVIADKIKQKAKEKDEAEEKEGITLENAGSLYLESIKVTRPSMYEREEVQFRIQIYPFLGKKTFVKDISKKDLEKFRDKLLLKGNASGKPLAPRSVEYCLRTLSKMFQFVEVRNVVSGLKMLTYDNEGQRYLTKEEVGALLKLMSKKDKNMYVMSILALHLGFRAKEVLGIKPMHINFHQGSVRAFDTKNKKSRTIYMTALVREILKESCKKKKPSELIFPNTLGAQRGKVSREFKKFADELNLNKGIEDRRLKATFHTLRHTYASWLIMSGKVDIYTLQKLMGHQSIKTTERYAHLAPDHYRESAAAMDGEFQGVMLSGVKEKDAPDKLGREID